MTAPIKILIVDDHALVRGSLHHRLESEPNFAVVGVAGTGDKAIDMTLQTNPDIVLMDIDMPGLNCFDAAKKIMASRREARIIFLSGFSHDRYIENALAIKASGYLTKNEPPETVIHAIQEVAAGGSCFSDEIRSRIVVDLDGARLAQKGHTRVSMLSPRELEVLQYVSQGMRQKEVARVMQTSRKTVDNQIATLMKKLDIHDRVELTRFAIREGFADA